MSETVITRRTRTEGFKALGVWITFDGHFTKELAEREVSAWRRFYAHHHLLCDNNVALKDCVCSRHVLCHRCTGALEAGSLHVHNARSVGPHVEICVPRLPDESAELHMTRWARLLRNCRAKHKFPHGDETYFASYFSWCGHIARIATRDPMRETNKLFQHKNIARLRSLKKETGT